MGLLSARAVTPKPPPALDVRAYCSRISLGNWESWKRQCGIRKPHSGRSGSISTNINAARGTVTAVKAGYGRTPLGPSRPRRPQSRTRVEIPVCIAGVTRRVGESARMARGPDDLLPLRAKWLFSGHNRDWGTAIEHLSDAAKQVPCRERLLQEVVGGKQRNASKRFGVTRHI